MRPVDYDEAGCVVCAAPLCLDSNRYCPDHLCSACRGLLSESDPNRNRLYCGRCACRAPACPKRSAAPWYGARYCAEHECPRCGLRKSPDALSCLRCRGAVRLI